jgi:hypothetical protein
MTPPLEGDIMQNDSSTTSNSVQARNAGNKNEAPSTTKHLTFRDWGASPDSKSLTAPRKRVP